MGLFRKMASASTLGAIDFKSDKERTATHTKQAAKQAKAQTRIMRAQTRAEARAQAQPLLAARGIPVQPAPAGSPASPCPAPSASQGYYVAPPSERRPSPPPVAPPAAPQGDFLAQLTALADLKQAGLLTDDEFTAAKAKLLG